MIKVPGILFYKLAGLGLNVRDIFYKRQPQLTKSVRVFYDIGEHDKSCILSFSWLFTIQWYFQVSIFHLIWLVFDIKGISPIGVGRAQYVPALLSEVDFSMKKGSEGPKILRRSSKIANSSNIFEDTKIFKGRWKIFIVKNFLSGSNLNKFS